MANRLGDEPIEQEYITLMDDVAYALGHFFNGALKEPDKKAVFVLMVLKYGEQGGRCNYFSNGANLADIVALMKEMIKRFEGDTDQVGHA